MWWGILLWCGLEYHCLLSVFEASLPVWIEILGSGQNTLTLDSLWASLNSHACGSPELHVHGGWWTLCVTGSEERWTRLVLPSSAHRHASASHRALLAKHKFKDKIVENFKMATTGNQVQGPSELWTLYNCPGHLPMQLALPGHRKYSINTWLMNKQMLLLNHRAH